MCCNFFIHFNFCHVSFHTFSYLHSVLKKQYLVILPTLCKTKTSVQASVQGVSCNFTTADIIPSGHQDTVSVKAYIVEVKTLWHYTFIRKIHFAVNTNHKTTKCISDVAEDPHPQIAVILVSLWFPSCFTLLDFLSEDYLKKP